MTNQLLFQKAKAGLRAALEIIEYIPLEDKDQPRRMQIEEAYEALCAPRNWPKGYSPTS